jgi:hypothetical protein
MNDVALYDHLRYPAGQNTILIPFTAQEPTRFPSYPSLHPLSLPHLLPHWTPPLSLCRSLSLWWDRHPISPTALLTLSLVLASSLSSTHSPHRNLFFSLATPCLNVLSVTLTLAEPVTFPWTFCPTPPPSHHTPLCPRLSTLTAL